MSTSFDHLFMLMISSTDHNLNSVFYSFMLAAKTNEKDGKIIKTISHFIIDKEYVFSNVPILLRSTIGSNSVWLYNTLIFI